MDSESLTLKLRFLIENKSITHNEFVLERIISNDTVQVYLRSEGNIKNIGFFVLSKNKKSIISKQCLDTNYCDHLVTSSGDEENLLLKEGN